MDHQQDSKSKLESPLIATSESGVEHGGKSLRKAEILTELKQQTQLAAPLVIVNFVQYSLQMMSIMFVGRLGELSLSSASMATSFAGVTGFSFMLGMVGGLETLCGQAYGAKQYHMLGVHLQRATLVLALASIPIALTWSCTEQIFIFFKQDPQISRQAGVFAWWLIPSILPYGLLQCQFRFLQSQKMTGPLMISTGISSLLHALTCWTLIFGFGLGSRSAALSIAISYWINVIMLSIYIKFSPKCYKTWTGFSRDGMKNLSSFLRLGIPSALMVCLEFSAYELLVLMSGRLPNPKLETSMMSISLSTSVLAFRIPYGFGSAVSTRVSNELGAGKPKAARLAVQVVLFLALAQGLLLSLIAVAVRDIWGYLYTNNEELVRYLASVMPVLALSNFMDGIQGVLSGTARGCGWQKIGAAVNLGAYYLVGLPCAITLTFVFHSGGKGLWMGIIFGSSLQAVVLLLLTMHTNWEQEAKKARERLNAACLLHDAAPEGV
ncbi:protein DETOXIFICATION 16-like [Tripterygium wilfordii]|uniref:protein DETOXIFICATION 16-like n=1 Tax=Tripterygium wilfordii TaxID=458696 RepID=UPI0018F81371|nr:protein DETOXIFICATION 16-like [Tripterygium wilfordii]